MTRRRGSSARDAGFVFDEAAADRASEFFERFLRHGKGEWAGQPFRLMDWQRDDIIRPLFGWKRPDGTRRYRRVYVEIPRKNGKSHLAAGVGLYLTFADNEPGAEVYSAASDREQAAIVFDIARAMVETEPALSARSEVYRRSIVIPRTGSSYKVLSADVGTKHGLNAHGVIFDELHTQPTRDLWDVLKTSMGARRQPVLFVMTTAGYDRTSICWEIHEYAAKVRDGIVPDDSLLPVIYAANREDDWTDPAVWARANPGLGQTIKVEYVREECATARETPAYQNTFRRLQLNQWTEQATRAIDMDAWEACGAAVNAEALAGCECFAGLDLSSTTDISALVLVFKRPEGRFEVLPFFWIPRDNLAQRVRRDGVPYDAWVRDGFIEATEGNVIDYDVIRARINALRKTYRIKEIAIDRWNATQLMTQLGSDGFTVVPFGQGWVSMSGPTKELLRLIVSAKLAHGGNPVLRWMASNLAVKHDAKENLWPVKDESSGRIDGIVALIMGLGRAVVTTEKRSVYETRGLLVT